MFSFKPVLQPIGDPRVPELIKFFQLDRASISELYGDPGVGKTQVAIRLTAEYLHYYQTETVLYISIDGFFRSERFFELSNNLYPNETLGDRLFVQHIYDADSLAHFMAYFLPRFCAEVNLGLLIIDSITSSLRICDPTDQKMTISYLEHSLRNQIKSSKLTVLTLNQVSASFGTSDSNTKPALGISWSNCVDSRYLMRRFESKTERELICVSNGYHMSFNYRLGNI